MISDLDIWRAAQVMIKGYGEGAATEAAKRADEFLDQGNLDGKQLWMRILQTIEELQQERPRDGERRSDERATAKSTAARWKAPARLRYPQHIQRPLLAEKSPGLPKWRKWPLLTADNGIN